MTQLLVLLGLLLVLLGSLAYAVPLSASASQAAAQNAAQRRRLGGALVHYPSNDLFHRRQRKKNKTKQEQARRTVERWELLRHHVMRPEADAPPAPFFACFLLGLTLLASIASTFSRRTAMGVCCHIPDNSGQTRLDKPFRQASLFSGLWPTPPARPPRRAPPRIDRLLSVLPEGRAAQHARAR